MLILIRIPSLTYCKLHYKAVMDLDMSWDFESRLTLALGVVGFWLLLVGQLS